MGLVSFRSPWASIILFDSRTKAGSALKTQRPYGPSVTELGWTQVHRLPAQHFSLGLLCSWESEAQLLQNSAVWSGRWGGRGGWGCGQSPSPRATSFLRRGWEDGAVCPGQQGALETDREGEEEQRSWPKEQPFEMISLCKFNCKDRWIFQQGWRANYEICFPKAIRTEKLHFKNSRWIENSYSMTVWSVLARLSIMLSKQVIHIFCSFFY